MTTPDPEEFRRFHDLLIGKAPPDYEPYYFRVEAGSKAPALEYGSWKDPANRLSVDEAVEWLDNGGNVGIAGTDDDRLVNVDIDDEDATTIDDIKPTLIARSRSRTGIHAWYFASEPASIPNIPTDNAGEVRANWQYVVAPGSYVETDPDDVPDSERENAGYYTIEREHAATKLTLAELPAVFVETYRRNQQLSRDAEPNNRPEPPSDDGTNNSSALFDIEATEVVRRERGSVDTDSRWSALFHGSTTDANMTLTGKGLLQCFRHNVTHNGLQALVVCSDYITAGDRACERVGTPHKRSGGTPSAMVGDDEAIWCAWRYAKSNGYLPDDDPVPYRALIHLCRSIGLADDEALPDDYDPNGDERIPAYAYDTALTAIEAKFGLNPGRQPVSTDGGSEAAHAAGDRDEGMPDAPAETDVSHPDCEPDWEDVAQMAADSETDISFARDLAVSLLRDTFHFATMAETDELYVYDDDTGIYRGNGTAVVHGHLEAKLDAQHDKQMASEIVHRIKAGSYYDRDEFGTDSSDPKVCLENGVLSLPDGDFSDHDPSELFTSYAPVEYDPDAECPNFLAFLDEVLESETHVDIVFEMLGYSLYPSHPFAKALFMYGDGRNGKSTLLDVFKRLLSRENVSSRSLVELAEDRFAAGDLYGAWANICGDLPNKSLKETGTFKKLTGGDLVTADQKYRQPFSFQNRANLIFSANDPPKISDDSTAMYRRLLLLNFPNEFTPPGQPGPDARPKKELMDEIASDEELSGILNHALEGLQRLFDRGEFSQAESVDQIREQYKRVSDPVYAFVAECVDESTSAHVQKHVLYGVYRAWARENDVPVKGKGVFSRELYKYADAEGARVQRHGERQQVYQGVELTSRGEEFRDDDNDRDGAQEGLL